MVVVDSHCCLLEVNGLHFFNPLRINSTWHWRSILQYSQSLMQHAFLPILKNISLQVQIIQAAVEDVCKSYKSVTITTQTLCKSVPTSQTKHKEECNVINVKKMDNLVLNRINYVLCKSFLEPCCTMPIRMGPFLQKI